MGTLIPTNRLNGMIPTRDELFQPFQTYFDKVMDELFSDSGMSGVRSKAGYPRMDVITKDDAWIIEAAMPGVKAEDVEVRLLEDAGQSVLSISGRMSEEHQHSDDATYHVRELKRSSFERRVSLPAFVKGEPDASMKNGVLRLVWRVPELQKPKPKQIAVKSED